MNRRLGLLLTIIINGFIITTCSDNTEESKSMEQLYKENGVPVKIEILEPKAFIKELSYHSAFSGVKETSKYASFGGRVEKIHARVGDRVEKNQLIISFPMDNPSANYYQAKTAYENAKLALDRLKNLKVTGGVSQQNYDNAEMQYQVAKANWDVVRKMVQVVAPFSGTISKISVSETENVKKEAELFTISKLNDLKSKVWITEKEIFDVKKGMPARAVWQDLELKGFVDRVDMAMNVKSQAFGALLKFKNVNNYLLLGLTAEIFIETYKNPQAIVVERKNIKNDNGVSFVFLNNDGIARKQKVTLGNSYGLLVEISDGLSSGDHIIVEGLMLIEDGTKIRIVE
jgi:RND family efflux transporter MFP subunit